MFLRLRAFLPQGFEQIVGVGLPPGHADKACIQLAEGFLDLPGLFFAGDARLDTVFVEQLPVNTAVVDSLREACKPSQCLQLGIEFFNVGLPQGNFRITL